MKWPHAKTAVITGAASGIGRALSVALAREGFKIGIADIDQDGAEETLKMVNKAGGDGEVYICDVKSFKNVQAMADHFFDAWGEVGLVVNNAGIGGGGMVGDIPIKDWETVVGINLWSVIYGCHVFIPRMKVQGGGHIANTASGAGLVSTGEMAPYCTTKAAVVALSEVLKTELSPFGIGVTVLCPSCVKTDVVEHTVEYTSVLEYSDGWGVEMLRTALNRSKITPEQEARRLMTALEKNRLYVKPQTALAFSWLNIRMAPETYFKTLAFLNRKGLIKPLFMKMAERGWL